MNGKTGLNHYTMNVLKEISKKMTGKNSLNSKDI